MLWFVLLNGAFEADFLSLLVVQRVIAYNILWSGSPNDRTEGINSTDLVLQRDFRTVTGFLMSHQARRLLRLLGEIKLSLHPLHPRNPDYFDLRRTLVVSTRTE